MEWELKELNKNNTKTLEEQNFKKLKETIADFLYEIKDKHPCSNPEKGEKMDVFERVMQFMKDNSLQPSRKLREKYKNSNTTKSLNEFPSYVTLKEKIGITREVYDKLKERYQSLPPFIYYFNQKIDIISGVGRNPLQIRFYAMGYSNKEMVILN